MDWVGFATSLVTGFNRFVLVYFLVLNTTYLLLFLLSLTGLAPDDSVLGPRVTAQSRWFSRGLGSAVLGTIVGAVTYGAGFV